ncbi:MAG: hypothetical protein FJX29_14495 [Alphaproteobacteria bacterium]|nr:hypothetical protein [Alphaproteobacteria bacterium]
MNICDGDKVIRHFEGAIYAILKLIQAGRITQDDVTMLRREIFTSEAITRDEAEALFRLERAVSEKCEGWTAFFVEAITDHTVWHNRPTGVVNTPQAEWLVSECDRTKSVTALAVLVNVLAEAHRVPLWLPATIKGRARAGWTGVSEALDAAQLEAA